MTYYGNKCNILVQCWGRKEYYSLNLIYTIYQILQILTAFSDFTDLSDFTTKHCQPQSSIHGDKTQPYYYQSQIKNNVDEAPQNIKWHSVTMSLYHFSQQTDKKLSDSVHCVVVQLVRWGGGDTKEYRQIYIRIKYMHTDWGALWYEELVQFNFIV